MATNVMLLGHSFIRRLNEFMFNTYGCDNLRLDYSLFDITCRAQGGLTIPRLIHERPDLYDFSVCEPDIVYLQIGGNDLSHSSSETVANEIYSFANFLHFGLHIPFVIIGELLLRDPNKVGIKYNDKVIATNISLLQKVQMDNLPNIIFWRHHGFWQDDSFLNRDWVHLNRQGMWKYFRSVRSSVLHAQSILGNISFV